MGWLTWERATQLGFVLVLVLIVVAFFYIRSQWRTINKLQAEVDSWMVDRLTGLMSRRKIMEMYRWLFDQVSVSLFETNGERRVGDSALRRLTLVMFNLDNFAGVNEAHGRAAGDQVMVKFGEILRDEIRHTDLAGRYAGDIFMVALATDANGAKSFCRRARVLFKSHSFAGKKKTFHVTASCGLAELNENISSETLIERAETALLAAKAAGAKKGHCFVWDRERFEDIV